MESFIKIEDLCFAYKDDEGNDVDVLSGLNLEIKKGELVAVLGHNGSGKSTLAKLINLILTPTSGKIVVDGLDITDSNLTEDQIFENRRNVGMVFQNPDNQLVATIVEEDIAFGPENLGVEPEEIRRRVKDALTTVKMSEFARHSPHQLSGGQKQRVAIAGIIAMMPRCIIFDESTAMLDPAGRKEVMETIIKLNREYGITVLHITHYMSEAAMCDRVIVINDGKIEFDDKPERVFTNVDRLQMIGLDVPQTVELMYMLNADGTKLPLDKLSVDECADEIMKLFEE